MKSDLRAMKQILYDMGPQMVSLQSFKGLHTLPIRIQAEKGPPPKNWKNKRVLKWL